MCNKTIKDIEYGCTLEQYINDDGYSHREDGPAYIVYDQIRRIKELRYYYEGKLHKIGGPAYVKYDSNGTAIAKQYWFMNRKFESYKELEFYVKTLCLN